MSIKKCPRLYNFIDIAIRGSCPAYCGIPPRIGVNIFNTGNRLASAMIGFCNGLFCRCKICWRKILFSSSSSRFASQTNIFLSFHLLYFSCLTLALLFHLLYFPYSFARGWLVFLYLLQRILSAKISDNNRGLFFSEFTLQKTCFIFSPL